MEVHNPLARAFENRFVCFGEHSHEVNKQAGVTSGCATIIEFEGSSGPLLCFPLSGRRYRVGHNIGGYGRGCAD